MTRAFGVISLVVALAVGGFLYTSQSKTTTPEAQQVETQASAATSATNFDAALPALQAWFVDHGTYAGVTLDPSFGVTVARADATTYCLQSPDQHLAGPDGTPAPGPC
jgi:hypothetical protein